MIWLLPMPLTALALWLAMRSDCVLRLAQDIPGNRSLHSMPVPRIGGLALMPVLLVCWELLPQRDGFLSILVLLLSAISFVDDRGGLPVMLRLAAHLLAAIFFTILVLRIDQPLPMLLCVLGITWFMNLYNFMDGADGVAGGMAVFGFSTLGIAAMESVNTAQALTCFAAAAGAVGFLLFNFAPAKVFLGDAGSIPLGFLAVAEGLVGWKVGSWPLWFPILIFSPFIVDATITLARRACRRERIWQAHRSHYYQRLVLMGWGHRKLALHEYGLMAACGISAYGLLHCDKETQCMGLAVWALIYIVLMRKIDKCWEKFSATLR